MKRNVLVLATIVVAIAAIGSGFALAAGGESRTLSATAGGNRTQLKFAAVDMFMHVNAAEGFASLGLDVEGEPVRRVKIFGPNGRKILDVSTRRTLRRNGLNILGFGHDQSFDEQPLDRFKKKFPAGKYTVRGVTADGRVITGKVMFNHRIPEKVSVTAPAEDAVVTAGEPLVVSWAPVTQPAGIEVEFYGVIVTGDTTDVDVTLPPNATSLTVSPEVLLPGDYTVAVVVIDQGANEILSEVPFTVQ